MRIPRRVLLNALGFGFQIVARALQVRDEPLDFCNRRRSYLLNEVPDRFAQFAPRFGKRLELWTPFGGPIAAHSVADFLFDRWLDRRKRNTCFRSAHRRL